MFRLGLSFSLILFSAFSVYPADDLSLVELLRGVNQARLEIENGEVQYIFHYNYAAQKSEAEIAAWIQTEKQRELNEFTSDPFFPDVGLKEFEEGYLIPNLNYWASREGSWTEVQKVSMAFQILASDETSFPKLYKYKMTIEESPGITLESQAAHFPQPGLFYLLSYDTQLQIKEDIGNVVFSIPSVQTWGSNYHAGFHHLWVFGRSGSYVPHSAKYLGKEQVDGKACYVLAFKREDGMHRQIWIDPEKAFCIRRAETRENPDSLVVKDIVEYKKFQRFGDAWYPTVIQFTLYEKTGSIRSSYGFKIISAEFNVNFPKDFFTIEGNFYGGYGQRVRDMDAPRFGQSPARPQTEAENLLLLCGPQSLLRICELLSVKSSLNELKKLSGFDPNRGTTLLGLKEAATYKGLAPKGVRASLALLKNKKVPLPAIAYVDGHHFLIFESVNKAGVHISDPAQRYNSHLAWHELTEIWEGELLIFDKKKARLAKQKQMPLAFTETPEYDFGQALGGSEIQHTFILKNIGQKPLKILSVTETCACTASLLSQDEIPAGGTGSVSAVLTVPSGNTQVEESLLVLTNDPTQPTLILTLKGEAFIPLTTFPERLPFGNQKPLQSPVTKQVSLHTQGGVQILGVRTDSEHLQATLKTDGKISYVEAQLLPSVSVGPFSHNVLIDYRYQGEKTTHDVLVFGEVLGKLQVTPKRLFFGLVKAPASISKQIIISSRDNRPFKINSVESSSNAVVAVVKESADKMRYQLITTINPTASPGEFSGEVVVWTSNPLQPVLRVPFFGIIAASD